MFAHAQVKTCSPEHTSIDCTSLIAQCCISPALGEVKDRHGDEALVHQLVFDSDYMPKAMINQCSHSCTF